MGSSKKRKFETIEENIDCKKIKSNASDLRNKLKNIDSVAALKDLISSSKENDLMSEYINAGGNAKEIIDVLRKTDKNSHAIANIVCAALHRFILKSITDFLLIQEDVEKQCDQFLSTYQDIICDMLNNSSSDNYKNTILQLFTAMVTLSNALGKKILTLFSINDKKLRIFCNCRSSSDKKLRTSFIHYLISFLIDNNPVLISELLQKKGLLSSIIYDLRSDNPEIIVFVLTSIREKIVENLKISKTLKLHTFSTPVLRSLVQLYDYNLLKNRSKDENTDNNTLEVQQTVRECAHQLLLELCTSYKKGILFHNRDSGSGKSCNQLILTLLESIEKPWANDLKFNLVTEILRVCPQFIKTVFSNITSDMILNISEEWLKIISFIKEIIQKQELDISDCEKHQIFSFLSSIIVPKIVKKIMFQFKSESFHPHPTVRFYVIELLYTVIHKISYFLNKCAEKYVSDENFMKMMRKQIDEFCNQNCIPSINLLKAIEIGVKIVNENDASLDIDYEFDLPDVQNYFKLCINVLVLYNELSPMLFSQLQVNDDINIPIIEMNDTESLLKLGKLIFFVHYPKPGNAQFTFMMKTFIEDYINRENVEYNNMIEYVLLNTNFFYGCENEIPIWLSCIKKISVQHASTIAHLIIDTLHVLAKKNKKFTSDISVLMSSLNDETDILNIEVFPDNYEKCLDSNEKFNSSPVQPLKLSPVVPALLYVLKKYSSKKDIDDDNLNAIKSFTVSILIHILHSQRNANGLHIILSKYQSSLIPLIVFDYINLWLCEDADIPEVFYPIISEKANMYVSSKLLLRKEFHAEELSSLIENSTEMECILLWNLCIFYIIQLNDRGSVTEEDVDFVIFVLQNISKKLSDDYLKICLIGLTGNYTFIKNFIFDRRKLRTSLFYVFTKIISDVIYKNKKISEICHKLLSPYRLRFILLLLQKNKFKKRIKISCADVTVENIIKCMMLSKVTVVNLLNIVLTLPIDLLINEHRQKVTEWSRIIASLLNEAAINLYAPVENDNLLTLLSKIPLILENHVLVDDLEQSLINYLKSFPHHLHLISDELIRNLILCHPDIDKLALFLLTYRKTYAQLLQDKIVQNDCISNNIDSTLETLQKLSSVSDLDEKIMLMIYEMYLKNVEDLINEKYSFINNFTSLIRQILLQFLDDESGLTWCKDIERNWDNLNINPAKYCILDTVFKKAKNPMIFIKLLIIKLTKLLTTSENVDWLSSLLYEKINELSNVSFLLNEEYWEEFIKISITVGLSSDNFILLRILRVSCEKSVNLNESVDTCHTVFHMVISHSDFVKIILGNSEMKNELMKLLLILTKTNTSLMSSNHLHLYMGAYKATLSESDQLNFKLLQQYEENGIRFSDCRPYLFGEAAVTYYNIRSDIGISVQRQPHPNQVLDLLDLNIIKNTIRYFPLDRNLKPEILKYSFEYEVYDMSFMLPLMSHLLARESRISVQKFTRTGGLSLVLIALSSSESDVRLAAFHCLLRFQSRLSSCDKENEIWRHFVNAIRNGLLTSKTVKSKMDIPPRLPCITTTFLSYMCLIISEPLHSLYITLTNFLLAKSSFDLDIIPNFLKLFYSTDMNHREHQKWILKIIKDGMRYEADWIISKRTFLYKLLLQYNFSNISNESIDVLILDILAAALRIQKCKLYVIAKYGFLSWLTQLIQSINEYHKHLLPSILNILESLTVHENLADVIYVILILLRKPFILNINDIFLEKLLSILSKVYCICKTDNIIEKRDVENIIKLSSNLLGESNTKMYENSLKYNSVLGVSEIPDSKISSHIVCILHNFIGTDKVIF